MTNARRRDERPLESTLDVRPLTPVRWPDLEKLFGPRGACAGCWCMFPRLTHQQYKAQQGEANRRAFRRLVTSGATPGVLGYVDGEPVAWCAVEPRERLPRLERSRILKPVDDQRVWSIPCLFVSAKHRRRGLSVAMIDAAVRWAARRGARIVESYPVAPKSTRMPPAFAWWGTVSAFTRAGFREVARPSPTRRIMRRLSRTVRP